MIYTKEKQMKGLPYRGSKKQIAKYIVPYLQAENRPTLIEPFAGGCSITDYCVANNIFQHYIINDYSNIALLYKEITGMTEADRLAKYGDWLTKEQFQNTDNTILKTIWSYNSNAKTYMFGKDWVEYHHALWENTIYNNPKPFYNLTGIELPAGTTPYERRRKAFCLIVDLIMNNQVDSLLDIVNKKEYYKERFELIRQGKKQKSGTEFIAENKVAACVDRILGIEHTDKVEAYQGDYRQLVIPDNVVIYCDPPYSNTDNSQYKGSINPNQFIEWAIEQSKRNPVYVSEIEITNPHFHQVWEMNVRAKTTNTMRRRTERLYRVVPIVS